jgi:hypothetical protein
MSGETPIWEYRVVDALDLALDLDALGRKGWELVAAGPTGDARRLYFKRAAATFRERVTLEQKRRVYGEFGLAVPDEEGPQA